MKAIVLAGGFATRLRPLSCTRQKLLFPVGNKPLLDWTLERLAKTQIDEVILAVNYMADQLFQHYEKSKYGMKLSYSIEKEPLGTGGAIKNAEKLVGDQEAFLVLNGDILTNFNHTKLLDKHERNKATATIALHHAEDPSRYGIVDLDEKNHVEKFIEKPAQKEASGKLINAGIYILDPRIFDYIPNGLPISIERHTFPKLVSRKEIYGYLFEDLWIDIGKPRDYLKANQLFLNTKRGRGRVEGSSLVGRGVKIEDPIAVCSDVTIGENSKIGPYVAIGKHVTLGKKVLIQNSIVFPQTTVSDATTIKGTIVGEGVIVGSHVKIQEGCIIGDHALIGDNVTLARGVTVCPHRTVSESVSTPKCLM